MKIAPSVGFSSPARRRSRVVLPARVLPNKTLKTPDCRVSEVGAVGFADAHFAYFFEFYFHFLRGAFGDIFFQFRDLRRG